MFDFLTWNPITIASVVLLGAYCIGLWVWMGKKGWLTMDRERC